MKSLVQYINESKESDILYDIFHIVTCSSYDEDVDNNEKYLQHFIGHLKDWIKKYDVKTVSYLVNFEMAKDMDFKKSDFKGLAKGKITYVKNDEINDAIDDVFKDKVDVDEDKVKYNDKYFYLEDSGEGFDVLVKKEN